MINIIKIIFIAIFELLPTSPFQVMFDQLMIDFDFLPYLNWFLPFDTCATMMLAWLDCVLVYYAFVLVKKIVVDFILQKVVSTGLTIAAGAGAITGI
ncbi:MAG: hypothetical protein K2N80_01775 [Lachnospiraceae bacterium]|nr:hypothetical protein [Lachnospiraceae bacterium]